MGTWDDIMMGARDFGSIGLINDRMIGVVIDDALNAGMLYEQDDRMNPRCGDGMTR